MKPDDKTSMGGAKEAFTTTRWSQIRRAQTQHDGRRQAVLGGLLARYWKPVYCYLRRKGHDNEAAKDLTQGFFHEVVLGRGLIQQADHTKGRFRTFLLTALDRYVTSVHRAQTAKKRLPKEGLLSLDGFDSPSVPEPSHTATPDEAYNYAWACTLVDQALAELEQECREGGKATHWEVFRARVLLPIADNVTRPLPGLCAELGIENESKASNMLVTAKRRFRAILRRLVRQFVHSDAQIDEEIRELMGILSGSGARS